LARENKNSQGSTQIPLTRPGTANPLDNYLLSRLTTTQYERDSILPASMAGACTARTPGAPRRSCRQAGRQRL